MAGVGPQPSGYRGHGKAPGFQMCDDDDESSLKQEHNRLKTFLKYPQTATQSSALLARNGFVYNGNGDTDAVKCVFCKTVKSGWRENDNIEEMHFLLSSHCPMVTNTECGNKPVDTNRHGMSWSALTSNGSGRRRTSKSKSRRNRHRSRDASSRSGSGAARDYSQSAANLSSVQNVTSALDAGDTITDNAQAITAMPTVPNSSETQGAMFVERMSPVTQAMHVSRSREETVRHPGTLVTNHTFHDFSNSEQQTTESENVGRNVGAIINNSTSRQNTTHHNLATTSSASPVSSSSDHSSLVDTGVAGSSFTNTPNEVLTSQRGNGNTTSATSNISPASGHENGHVRLGVEHNGHNRETSNHITDGNSRITYADLSILTARPKRIEYAIKTNRLQSFQGWPSNHHLKPVDLADAGFFFTGYSDTARCYYCGGGLRNWDLSDDVWVEHARWFPKCVFMKITKGQRFVDTVQELKEDHETISYRDVMNKMSSTNCSQDDDSLKRDPAVIAVVNFGFLIDDVVRVAKTMESSGTPLTSDVLYEQLIKEKASRLPRASRHVNSNRITVNGNDDTATVASLKETNLELRQQSLCKICYEKEVGVIFLPCGHFVSCTDCAGAMKNCPVCRDDVKGLVRAFMT